LNSEVVDTALSTVDKAFEQNSSVGEPVARDTVADQILRETLLTVSSDWPFMVSKDSAADYARYRAHLHAHAAREIAGALATGRRGRPRSARIRFRLRHDGVDTRHGSLDDACRAGYQDLGPTNQTLAPRRRARTRLAGRPPGYRFGRILRRAIGFHDPRHRGGQALWLGVGPDQQTGTRRGVLAGA